MQQLTATDTSFLTMETPTTFGHVGSVVTYEPGATYDAVIQRIEERLHLLPPYRRQLVEVPMELDHPYWIESPNFDLDFHVREIAVPPPGTREQLADLVARIAARPPGAAGRPRRPHRGPAPRSVAAAVGVLRDRRLRDGRSRPLREDAPRHHRWGVGRGDDHRHARRPARRGPAARSRPAVAAGHVPDTGRPDHPHDDQLRHATAAVRGSP